MRILVIDDDPGCGCSARSRSAPMATRSSRLRADSEALELLEIEAVDAVVLDVMLPSVNGFEILRRIRQDARTRDLPVVLLSVRVGMQDQIDGWRAGADDYLTKPFSPSALAAKVYEICATDPRERAEQRSGRLESRTMLRGACRPPGSEHRVDARRCHPRRGDGTVHVARTLDRGVRPRERQPALGTRERRRDIRPSGRPREPRPSREPIADPVVVIHRPDRGLRHEHPERGLDLSRVMRLGQQPHPVESGDQHALRGIPHAGGALDRVAPTRDERPLGNPSATASTFVARPG